MDLNEAAKLIGEYADKNRIESLRWDRYTGQWTALVYENIKTDNTSFLGVTDANVVDAIDDCAATYPDKLREY